MCTGVGTGAAVSCTGESGVEITAGIGVEGTAIAGTISAGRAALFGAVGALILIRERERSTVPDELADDTVVSKVVSPRSSGSNGTGIAVGERPDVGVGKVRDGAPPGGGGGGRISL